MLEWVALGIIFMTSQPTPALELSQLLIKELDELNNWVRMTLQIYFGWYCVFITVNGAGLAALTPPRLDERPAYILFALWNALGILISIPMALYVNNAHRRVSAIQYALVHHRNHMLVLQSPIPTRIAVGAIVLVVVALSSLLITWTLFIFTATPRPTRSQSPASLRGIRKITASPEYVGPHISPRRTTRREQAANRTTGAT